MGGVWEGNFPGVFVNNCKFHSIRRGVEGEEGVGEEGVGE